MTTARFKRIKDYDSFELDNAIKAAVDYCEASKLEFWVIFNGVDAYFERRRRREEKEQAARLSLGER